MDPVQTSHLCNIYRKTGTLLRRRKHHPLTIYVIGQHKIQTAKRKKIWQALSPKEEKLIVLGPTFEKLKENMIKRKKVNVV